MAHARDTSQNPGGRSRKKRRKKRSEHKDVTIEIRNIRGVRSSMEAIHAAVERRKEDGRPPIDVFVFVESFSTLQAPLELEGYDRLQGVSATRKDSGREDRRFRDLREESLHRAHPILANRQRAKQLRNCHRRRRTTH